MILFKIAGRCFLGLGTSICITLIGLASHYVLSYEQFRSLFGIACICFMLSSYAYFMNDLFEQLHSPKKGS